MVCRDELGTGIPVLGMRSYSTLVRDVSKQLDDKEELLLRTLCGEHRPGQSPRPQLVKMDYGMFQTGVNGVCREECPYRKLIVGYPQDHTHGILATETGISHAD